MLVEVTDIQFKLVDFKPRRKITLLVDVEAVQDKVASEGRDATYREIGKLIVDLKD